MRRQHPVAGKPPPALPCTRVRVPPGPRPVCSLRRCSKPPSPRQMHLGVAWQAAGLSSKHEQELCLRRGECSSLFGKRGFSYGAPIGLKAGAPFLEANTGPRCAMVLYTNSTRGSLAQALGCWDYRESYRITRTPLQCQGVGRVPRTGWGPPLSHHERSDADGSVGR